MVYIIMEIASENKKAPKRCFYETNNPALEFL